MPASLLAALAAELPAENRAPAVRAGRRPGGWVADYLRDPGGTLLTIAHHLREWAINWGPILIPVLALCVSVLVMARWWWARRCHARLLVHARIITVLAPPTVDPTGGIALWSNLVGLLRPAWRRALSGQPHLACEYVFSQTGVGIRLWVPGVIPPGLIERAIEAAWPGAHTRTGPASPPLPAPGIGQQRLVVVAGELRLARPESLPIRTDFDADPLRALLGAPAGLSHHQYACVQILARPVTGRRVAHARYTARRIHTGGSSHLAGRLLDLITPGTTTTRHTTTSSRVRDPQTSLEHSATNRAITSKQRGPQYETRIRYAVAALLPAAASKTDRRTAREMARGRAHALAAAFACYTEHNHYTRHRLRRPATTLTQRRLPRGDLLSVPELAALAHLPTDPAIPGLQRAGARALAPPPGIATPGPAAKPLGASDTGQRRPVALRVADARHHLHVIGATGSGKSTLLANLILADIDARRGIVLIDPKGDLVTDLLSRLPRTAADRVVLFDADNRAHPPCLNPLDGPDTDRIVDNLVSVFRRIYSAWWGPRTDDLMRAACLTLRAQPGAPTLADVPKLLADPAFRSRLTGGLTDPVLAGFWSWYEQLTDPARAQVISPLMNKLRAFLLRPFVRDALTGPRSTIDLGAVLDGGICLVRIPKGSLGDETTRLIGSLVVARTWQATTARARTPQSQRRDAGLYLDECHNFLNLPYPIEDMLAEARAFRLAITLAHQHLGQLSRDLREGISTNARNKIFFTASPEDARELARHTTPRLSEHDLAHLGAYHAAARLVLHGAHTEPFTMTTSPLPLPTPGRTQQIRRALRAHTTPASVTPTSSATAPPPTHPISPPLRAPATRAVTPTSPPRSTDPRRCR